MNDESWASTATLRNRLLARKLERQARRSWMWGATVMALLMMSLFIAALAQASEVPRAAYEYRRNIIQEGRSVWGVHAPTGAFAGQIAQESAWRPDARSRVGAAGLAQFMPATAEWISKLYPDLFDYAPMNPRWAIRALVRYDKFLHDRVAALDDCERFAFALAAYNGGLGWVNKRKAISPQPLVCLYATCDLNPGITPSNQRENQEYPRRILLRHAPKYVAAGFGPSPCEV